MLGKIIAAVIAIFGISSYKYLPGSYTVRFFWLVADSLYLKALDEKPKSPFTPLIRNNKCCLLECDFFGLHKNNVTYFTELDLCRTECALNALHIYFKTAVLKKEKFAYVPLASITNHFTKEIKPFQNYSMSTKIVGWGDKWVWLITVFTIDEKVKPVEPVTNTNDDIPENIPPLYLGLKDGDKKGKRVCCISLGKLVFKAGRKTLKPWDVVQLAGVNDVDIDAKGRLNEVRVSKHSNNAVELLKIYEEA